MNLKFTILGCGNSTGVPSVGNFWGACDPSEPKNRRTRCSLAVQSEKTTLIVDTGPDFREQVNRFNIQSIDAVLYSHQHSDHVNGIDDLRGFFYRHGRQPIDVYGSQETLSDLGLRFDYLFNGGNNDEFYPPIVKANIITEKQFSQPQTIGDINFVPYKVDHGTCTATGYRFGNLAYTLDMKSMDAHALHTIEGVKIWIVDGAAYKKENHAVHADLQTIFEYNKIVGAEEVYISSLSTLMDYKTLCDELPKGFYPAHDGLILHI